MKKVVHGHTLFGDNHLAFCGLSHCTRTLLFRGTCLPSYAPSVPRPPIKMLESAIPAAPQLHLMPVKEEIDWNRLFLRIRRRSPMSASNRAMQAGTHERRKPAVRSTGNKAK